jgi:hypothetical protein
MFLNKNEWVDLVGPPMERALLEDARPRQGKEDRHGGDPNVGDRLALLLVLRDEGTEHKTQEGDQERRTSAEKEHLFEGLFVARPDVRLTLVSVLDDWRFRQPFHEVEKGRQRKRQR